MSCEVPTPKDSILADIESTGTESEVDDKKNTEDEITDEFDEAVAERFLHDQAD